MEHPVGISDKEAELFIKNVELQKEQLIKNPITPEEMLLAHKECPTCVPFFQVLEIFYQGQPRLNLKTFCDMFLDRTTVPYHFEMVQSQFNHLAWLHQ